jgi:hypothetical protein
VKVYYHSQERPAAEALAQVLGHGSVNDVPGELSTVLSIDTAAGVQDVIQLTNGHYRTPKHEDYCRLLDWYQALDPAYLVSALPLDQSPLYSNAWLAGFADGDACFTVTASEATGRVGTTFELVQSRVDLEHIDKYYPIMQALAAFLFSKLGTTLVKNASGTMSKRLRARNTAQAGAGAAAMYFTSFPMLSSKQLDFEAWRSAYARTVLRQAKTGDGFAEMRKLKESMNSKRSQFTWDHLQRTYTR